MGTLKVNNIEPTSGNSVTVDSELLIKGPSGDIIIIGGTGSSNLSASYAATAGCASNIKISSIVPGDPITSVVLVSDQAVGCQSPFIDDFLTYNAATNLLSATVTYAQNAQNATFATSTSNVYTTSDDSSPPTSSDFYLTFVDSNNALSAPGPVYTSNNISYNNSQSNLSITGNVTVSGDLRFPNSGSAVVRPIINLVPTGTASFNPNSTNTTTYSNYGINLITTATSQSYCLRLPQIPTTGKTVTIINNSGINVTVFPSMLGGEINGMINGYTIIPSDGKSYSFDCYENPLPGGWSLSASPTASYAVTASYVTTAQTASYIAASNVNGTVANAATASYVTTAQTASYVAASNINGIVANAATASYVNLTAGPGILIDGLDISSSIVTVNGVFPTNGNVATTLTQVATGTSASLVISSSGAVTSSLPDGLVWIVSNDLTPSNNGDAYIFHSSSVGAWYPISPLDVPAADARYLKLDGINSPMLGDLNMGAKDLTNVNIMFGTASWAFNAQTASYVAASNVVGTVANALSASYAISASYEINYETSSSYADFAQTASYAYIANIVQETVYDNFLPSGSNISSSAYLNWGINLIPSASGMLDFACRLPNPPLKGRNVTIINTCGLDVHVYPSVNGGSIEGEIDGFAVVPSDGKSYTFICYENPLPGGWVVSNPLPIIGNYDTNNVNFGNLVWQNPNPNYYQAPVFVDFFFVSNQNYPYPVTTPIQSSITASGINTPTFSFENGIPYYGNGIPNPNLPASAYIHSKWYSMNGGGGGGLIFNTLRKAPWNAQSQAISPYPSNYVNLTTVGTICEYQFFNPPPGQPQYDYDTYALNTQFSGGSVIKPTAGTWRRIKKITVTSNISSSFLVNATTDSNLDIYTPGSNPYFVSSGWAAGTPNPITDFFYAPQLLPTLNAPTAPVSYADPSISYQSYQKPGTFVPSVGTYTTSQVGGPGTRVIEITYPENAQIAISDFIGSIKLARRNSNLITNNAAFISSYPKVDYWLTRGLGVKVSLSNQYMTIPIGSVLNDLSFRIKVEYQQ